jgi:hypothetical protein
MNVYSWTSQCVVNGVKWMLWINFNGFFSFWKYFETCLTCRWRLKWVLNLNKKQLKIFLNLNSKLFLSAIHKSKSFQIELITVKNDKTFKGNNFHSMHCTNCTIQLHRTLGAVEPPRNYYERDLLTYCLRYEFSFLSPCSSDASEKKTSLTSPKEMRYNR